MKKKILPYEDESGYYEIRLESIGGLGANLAGKMLGELGALSMGLNASSFSSYGSEKKGSPVRAFVRYKEGKEEILRNSPVINPHLLGIFHEAMAKSYPVFAGIRKETRIVLNTFMTAQKAKEQYNIKSGILYCLDAGGIGRTCGCRLNMVMLGALTAASEFLSLEEMEKICRSSLEKKYPNLIEANLNGIRAGYDEVKRQEGMKCGNEEIAVDNLAQSPAGCGLDSMAEPYAGSFPNVIGGINPAAGNSIENNLAPGREGYVPVFHPERCIQCGLCDSTCPDMVFKFEPGIWKGTKTMVNQGPDYQYCKGCLRCVQVCPVAALTKEEERKAREEGLIREDGRSAERAGET